MFRYPTFALLIVALSGCGDPQQSEDKQKATQEQADATTSEAVAEPPKAIDQETGAEATAQEMMESGQQSADEMLETGKQVAGETWESAKESGSEMVQSGQETATEMLESGKETAGEMWESGKEAAEAGDIGTSAEEAEKLQQQLETGLEQAEEGEKQ